MIDLPWSLNVDAQRLRVGTQLRTCLSLNLNILSLDMEIYCLNYLSLFTHK